MGEGKRVGHLRLFPPSQVIGQFPGGSGPMARPQASKERGNECFRKKDFVAAKECFDEATQGPSQRVSLKTLGNENQIGNEDKKIKQENLGKKGEIPRNQI